jgi:outer membrane protein assembly factor BamB
MKDMLEMPFSADATRKSVIQSPILWLSLSIFSFLWIPGETTFGGDWPQILGPQRNGVAANEKLAATWPGEGPKTLWQRDVGSGLAGVAVADCKVVLFHRLGDEEIVEALDAQSGKPLWKTSFPTRYVSGISPDDGPRCVPLIHQGFVYVHGAEGAVSCVALKDGAKRWSRDLRIEYEGPEGYFGAGSTPLVEGDKLLVNVGGREGAGLVAVSLEAGDTVWKATDEGASYSSPVAVTLDGVRQVIFVTRLNAVSIDPENGKVRWRLPFGQRGPTVNGANPIVLQKQLFLTSSYGIGAKLVNITKDSAEIVWENDDTLSSQFTTSVIYQGVLYGIHGRQDVGGASLRAIDPLTGKIYWSEERFGSATLILAGDKILALKTEGELVLVAAAKTGYKQLASAEIFDSTAQPLPALSNGRLYVRDTRVLKCLEVGEGKIRSTKDE